MPTRPRELPAAAVRAVRRMSREHIDRYRGGARRLRAVIASVPCVAAFIGIVGVLGSDPETTDALARIAREGDGLDRGRRAAVKGAARHALEH